MVLCFLLLHFNEPRLPNLHRRERVIRQASIFGSCSQLDRWLSDVLVRQQKGSPVYAIALPTLDAVEWKAIRAV